VTELNQFPACAITYLRVAGPGCYLDEVEYGMPERIARLNMCRLLKPLAYLVPAEYRAQFDQSTDVPEMVGGLN